MIRYEKLKKTRGRGVVRASFTRNLGLLNTELARGVPQIQELQVRFALVREKANELEELFFLFTRKRRKCLMH